MTQLILDHVYQHERQRRDEAFLTQPTGQGEVVTFTWGETMDQARRMAAHLRAQGFEPGARIAMLAKNSAHFFMVDLAVWMAGGTTVAIFPTEGPDTVRYVLEHSDAKLLFVGKLDDWPRQAPCTHRPLSGRNSAPWAKHTMCWLSPDIKRSLRYCMGTCQCGQLLR